MSQLGCQIQKKDSSLHRTLFYSLAGQQGVSFASQLNFCIEMDMWLPAQWWKPSFLSSQQTVLLIGTVHNAFWNTWQIVDNGTCNFTTPIRIWQFLPVLLCCSFTTLTFPFYNQHSHSPLAWCWDLNSQSSNQQLKVQTWGYNLAFSINL